MAKKDRICHDCGSPCFGKTCMKCFQSHKIGLSKRLYIRRQNQRRKRLKG